MDFVDECERSVDMFADLLAARSSTRFLKLADRLFE